MLILGFDTTGRSCSAAINENEKLIGERYVENGNTHSVSLMPMIDELLKSQNIKFEQIDAIALSAGPGSYTGIRIGVCTAKGLAHARNVPIIPVNTLYALALNARQHLGFICPVMDARRGEVYCAVYDNTRSDMRLSEVPRAMELEELLNEQKVNSPLYLGDGARLSIVCESGADIADERIILQHASSVCLAGYYGFKNGDAVNYDTLKPDYLRKFKL